MSRENGPPAPRWRLLAWPLLVLLSAAGIGYLVVWTRDALSRQHQVVQTVLVSFVAGVVVLFWLFVWLLFLSRLRVRTRLLTFGAVVLGLVLLVGLASLTLELRGVSGDTVPIFAWRWTPEPGAPGSVDPAKGLAEPPAAPPRPSPFDYPQFLGPRRDGEVTAVELDADWTGGAPRELWRREIGAGWSAFAVAGHLALTQEQRGDEERVTCYDVRTGDLIWSHSDVTRFEEAISGLGPRATPTIDGDRVFAIGATGRLNALDLATGRRLWSVEVFDPSVERLPDYGVATSPLVYEGKVVVGGPGGPAGSLVAYDRDDGRLRWSGGDDPPAYSSPVPAELAERRQIVILNGAALVSHDAGNGRVLWRREWPSGTEKVSQAVILPGDKVFISTGYGVGGKLFQVAADGAGGLVTRLIWESRSLKAKFTNVVHRDGYLYGLDDGILVSVDLEDGRRMWKRGRYGHGQVILVGGLLLILAEEGEVALVEARPDAYVERGRFRALSHKTWNHPALAGRYLLVRNDREAACYEMPLTERSKKEQESN